jgi:opacity protein-like surface antigen
MKKIILLLFACSIVPAVYSQSSTTVTTTTTTTTPEETVVTQKTESDHDAASKGYKCGYIGARGLATLSSWRVQNLDKSTVSTDFVVGFGGGGIAGVNFSKHVGLQLEVLYSELAQKYKDNSGVSRNLKLNYLNIPLLLMLNTDVSRVVNLNVCAGPQVGINTGSSFKTESANSSDMVDTVHAVLAVKAGDIGIAYGIGLDFMLSPSLKLSLGYRGVQGLVDVSDNSKNATTNDYYILDRAHVNTYSGYAGLAVCF